MPRKYGRPSARLIYPEAVDSEQIRALAKNPIHLLIFWSLFHYLDDQGRGECRISTIQSKCLGHLPEDAVDVDTVKAALNRMRRLTDEDGIPLIYIYPANGTRVIQMARWWSHQGGMRNAWPSRWDPMPGWVDDIRGHGKKAMDEIISDNLSDGGVPNGDPTGGNSSLPSKSVSRSRKSSNEDQVKPWDLFAAYLEVLGLSHKDFPGYRLQLKHAKNMIADGFTASEVKTAAEAFAADPYWSKNGFDLSRIHVHWGKMKNQGKAKRKPSPNLPIDEDQARA